MSAIYRVDDQREVRRRQQALPRNTVVEVWPDVFEAHASWISETTKRILEREGVSLPMGVAIESSRVAVFYPLESREETSLPPEESLRVRVLAGHGIAATWYAGPVRPVGRPILEPTSPEDPLFSMTRMGSRASHLWRLFRSRDEAVAFMARYFAADPGAAAWAAGLTVASFPELLRGMEATGPGG